MSEGRLEFNLAIKFGVRFFRQYYGSRRTLLQRQDWEDYKSSLKEEKDIREGIAFFWLSLINIFLKHLKLFLMVLSLYIPENLLSWV